MANQKISARTVLTGTGLISAPVVRAGSTTDYRRVDNLSATTNPTISDDSADGYHVGSLWMRSDNGRLFRCLDATAGAARWARTDPPRRKPVWGNTAAYITNLPASGSLTAATANRLYMVPVFIEERRTFTEIAFVVTTAGAASTTARVGLFNMDDNAIPTTLIAEGTTGASTPAYPIPVDATGIKTGYINVTLDPGAYHLAFLTNGAPTLVANISPAFNPLGTILTTTNAYTIYEFFRNGATYAALTDETTMTSASINASGTMTPIMGIR
jgi:hypothetical protein